MDLSARRMGAFRLRWAFLVLLLFVLSMVVQAVLSEIRSDRLGARHFFLSDLGKQMDLYYEAHPDTLPMMKPESFAAFCETFASGSRHPRLPREVVPLPVMQSDTTGTSEINYPILLLPGNERDMFYVAKRRETDEVMSGAGRPQSDARSASEFFASAAALWRSALQKDRSAFLGARAMFRASDTFVGENQIRQRRYVFSGAQLDRLARELDKDVFGGGERRPELSP